MLILISFMIIAFSAVYAQPPSNKIWDSLLQRYVNENGLVNYKGIITDLKIMKRGSSCIQ